jgi:alpha-tubulin suppressor-like RCC1 family protein
LSWGVNNHGQLGKGDNIDRGSPTVIDDVADIITIACGANASAFINLSGSIYTFGQGDSGFTGHGHERDLLIPTPLSQFDSSNPAVHVSCKPFVLRCRGILS